MNELREARRCGSRYATRVRIAAPQGSAYNGQTGVVVEVIHPGAIVVRLLNGHAVLFGRSELEVLR
jgi:hypothetical protein